MIACGIDAGLKALKIVLLQKDDLIYSAVLPMETNSSADIAEKALNEAFAATGIAAEAFSGIFVTGVGSPDIPDPTGRLPEASCIAAGVEKLRPSFDGFILDIGAHKAIAVRCKEGLPYKASYSDRCASGSGIYLEMVAQLLGMEITDIGRAALQSKETVSLQSTCAIYAETEIISLLHNRKRPEDILKGVFAGFAARMYPLLVQTGFVQGKTDLVVIGGVARNIGLIEALKERMNIEIQVPEDPDILSAFGAAWLGKQKIKP
jgi:predicted CoA-substrate-specific enzyme activase